jgi:hypothetical protein
MANHIIEVLFQGIWSSLTGGWFYDQHLSLFINTVHMYAWIFLFSFPFLIYLVSFFFVFLKKNKKNIFFLKVI